MKKRSDFSLFSFLTTLTVHCFALLISIPAHAIVNPEGVDAELAPWYANILIQLEPDEEGTPFCKGVLINPQWVLTSAGCLFDPFKFMGDSASSNFQFEVKLAGAEKAVKASGFQISDDFSIALLKLLEPVDVEPVSISAQLPAGIEGEEVVVLGNERSESVSNSYYNPLSSNSYSCKVNGEHLVNDGAYCYLLAQTYYLPEVQGARATIVNPLAVTSSYPVDDSNQYITDGSQFYLQYDAPSTYACVEDLGGPVVHTLANGTQELVGIVGRVGMARFFPVCHGGIRNDFLSVTYYKNVINELIATYEFANLCPEAPYLGVHYQEQNRIRLSWTSVNGAKGYKLHYTDAPGVHPYQTIDYREGVSISTVIKPGVEYLVAVTAYNKQCSSPLSDVIQVYIRP